MGVWWVVVSLFGVLSASLIDKSSFIHRETAVKFYEYGNTVLHEQFAASAAVENYEKSFRLQPNPLSAYRISWLLELLGDRSSVHYWQQKYLHNDYHFIQDLMNKGVLHHYSGHYEEAIAFYNQVLHIDPFNYDALYHKGVSYQYIGDVLNAGYCYYAAITAEPLQTKAMLNMATLNQKYGSLESAVTYYLQAENVFDQLRSSPMANHKCAYFHPHSMMVQYNLALAYFQLDQLDKAFNTTKHLINKLEPIYQALLQPENTFSTTNDHDPTQCVLDSSQYDVREIAQSLAGARGSLSKIQRAALYWAQWEELHESLVVATLQGIAETQSTPSTFALPVVDAENECNNGSGGRCTSKRTSVARTVFAGPLLPFDTLMMQMPLPVMLHIATAASMTFTHYEYQPTGLEIIPSITCTSELPSLQKQPSSLQERDVGYKNHPLVSPVLQCSRKLRLGFISFDFNDHPTAHLIDAIFHIVRSYQGCDNSNDSNNSCSDVNNSVINHLSNLNNTIATPSVHNMHNLELIIFSYGKDDESQYRARLQRLAHKFVDIVSFSFQQAAEAIRAEHIDVLLDLQIHTLGNRLEITASGVAPLVVNYLVYPGTSGAKFYDYLVADSRVVPCEHSIYYSERLLLLPATYQISTYAEYTREVQSLAMSPTLSASNVVVSTKDKRRALRRLHNLPDGPEDIILCNFNKINKIDPESFALWVQILREVPNSYLWLLQPSRRANPGNTGPMQELLKSFVSAGVAARRILFAPRADKNAHIRRHAAADLFLDTIVYGAHSTATDALRGGLPVLTLCGEAFPSRVVTSLYASLLQHTPSTGSPLSSASATPASHNTPAHLLNHLLVTDSAKEFVDTAVRIVRGARQFPAQTEKQTVAPQYSVRRQLAEKLRAVVEGGEGLFNTAHNVGVFVHSMEAIHEAHDVQKQHYLGLHNKFHVIIL